MANFQDTIQKLNQQYFDAIINPVDRIYVDMEMLQDFRLGALMSTASVKEEIAYITSRIPEYNKKFNLRTAEYFPVLKKTDEELDTIIKNDPFKVAYLSPWTNIYNNFHAVLSFLMINDKAVSDKVRQLEVVVNCADMDYPIELFDRFATLIQKTYPRVSIKLSHQPRYSGTTSFYSDFNMFFMYDHETFLKNEALLDHFTRKDQYFSKIVYTLPLINDSLKIDPSMNANALAFTSAMLNMFCDFYYMQGGIPITK